MRNDPSAAGNRIVRGGSFHDRPHRARAAFRLSYAAWSGVHNVGFRVVCAVDCGMVVNPDNVAAQMEGGIAFGLTAALKAEAAIKNGRTQQSNFHDYPILRMDDMTVVEVYIIPGDRKPTGDRRNGGPADRSCNCQRSLRRDG